MVPTQVRAQSQVLSLTPRLVLALYIASGSLLGCASIERGRYGVAQLELEGMHSMDSAPLRDCLLTRERPSVKLRLGSSAAKCSEPPFSSSAPELALWSWGWTDWPTFNRSVFEQDTQRILRWYRARGFYEASIEASSFDPPEAGRGHPCDAPPCELKVHVVVHEGEPVNVASVEFSGIDALPVAVQTALRDAVELHPGKRLDEYDYDRSKQALLRVLRDNAFAAARVEGSVHVVVATRQARVAFELDAGAPYVFGAVHVVGQGQLQEKPILAAGGVHAGEPYRPARVEEMRAEVLALGAFSTVEIEERPDREHGQMDFQLKVTPLSTSELRLGVGVASGANVRAEGGDMESIPQWDIHLLGRYVRRHLWDTLGALILEDSPRLIFGDVFPSLPEPDLGNIATLKLHQPGLIEARTDLFFRASWDYGPDPFLNFTRSDISLRLGARRGFFTRHLRATLALQQDIFVVPDPANNPTSDGTPTPSTYHYAFLEENLELDLRDKSIQPRQGAYFGLNVTESIRNVTSDWTTLRLAPDARLYFPLPFTSVLALRFALGAILIFDVNPELDELSQQLGPSSYRLRGGGASSVRGFLPGELGAGSNGGLRRWESMLEWRVPLGTPLTVVAFLDAGDVNDAASFRFGHLNTTIGFGVRYFTLVGPLRLDAGFRVPAWQRADGSDGIEDDANTFPLTHVPGALHLTIGDSF